MEPHVWHVTREQIDEYAEASGDRNPIHLDEDFARSVGLPGVIAHGMLAMAHLANLVVAYAGGDPRRVNPLVPVDLVINHSVVVDRFGSPLAFR